MKEKISDRIVYRQPISPPAWGKIPRPGNTVSKSGTFDSLLQEKIYGPGAVKISAHAEKRLLERNIRLAPEDMAKIGRAMQKVSLKGGRDSLLVYGDLVLIASIKNNTVVTALDSKALKEEQVFTNIDSAVIIK